MAGLERREEGQVLETSKPFKNTVAVRDIVARLVAHFFAVAQLLVLPVAYSPLFVCALRKQ